MKIEESTKKANLVGGIRDHNGGNFGGASQNCRISGKYVARWIRYVDRLPMRINFGNFCA